MPTYSTIRDHFATPIPDFLAAARDAIRSAGFDAEAYAIDGYGTGLATLRSHVVQVAIPKDDPRVRWDHHNVHTTPYCVAWSAGPVTMKIPGGFEFNAHPDGSHTVSCRVADATEAEHFAACFTHPQGQNGLIIGPLCRPRDAVSETARFERERA